MTSSESSRARGPFNIAILALLVAVLLGATACSASDPEEQAASLASAKQAYDAGRFSEAEEQLTKILDSEPDNIEALSTLALAQAAQGKNEEAIDQYAKIVQLQPDDHASWYRMALLERIVGRAEQAEEHLARALAEKKSDRSYSDELARTKMSLGDYLGAAELWGSLLEADGLAKESRKELLLLQGQAYQEAKDYESALDSLEQALKLDPEDEALRERVESFK